MRTDPVPTPGTGHERQPPCTHDHRGPRGAGHSTIRRGQHNTPRPLPPRESDTAPPPRTNPQPPPLDAGTLQRLCPRGASLRIRGSRTMRGPPRSSVRWSGRGGVPFRGPALGLQGPLTPSPLGGRRRGEAARPLPHDLLHLLLPLLLRPPPPPLPMTTACPP